MVSPHMLRPFTSRQLSLVSGDGRVVVFAALGGRYAGPSLAVHAPTLVRRVRELGREVRTVVFVDEPVPDAPLVALVDDMVEVFADLDVDAYAQPVPLTEAIKTVEGGLVTGSVSRGRLVAAGAPEVVARAALDRAVAIVGEEAWVNPTALVAASGGSVAFAGTESLPAEPVL